MRKRRMLLKVTALLVAAIFLHQQIAGAAGGSMPQMSGDITARKGAFRMDIASGGIRVPSQLAQIEKKFITGNDGLIINIQDCHSSLSAQYSIVNILKDLLAKYDVHVVAIEGAAGYIDTSVLGSFPDENIKERTASYLMKEGKISAGEFFSVMTEDDVALYGVEDNALYQENLKSFRKIYAENRENIAFLNSLLEKLKDAEKRVYSSRLNRFIFKSGLHRKSKISFDVYWHFLEKVCGDEGISTGKYSNIRGFLDSIELEKSINFGDATSERKLLIDELMSVSNRQQLQTMVLQALSLKKGKISEMAYYDWLLKFAGDKNIDAGKYRNFYRYVRYISRYQDLDIIGLQNEIERIENDILAALFRSSRERQLYRLVKITELMRALFEIRLTGKDVSYLAGNINDLEAADFLAFLAQTDDGRTDRESFSEGISRVISEAKKSLRFYELAEKRNNAMLANTIRAMRREGKRVAALISGGHHSRGLTQLMEQKGLSYFLLMPKFSNDVPRPYVAVLTKKAGPYRELVESGAYDLALEAYFDTGNLSELEDMLAYSIGQSFLAGKDIRLTIEEWMVSYRKSYEALDQKRLAAMTTRPIAPDSLERYLKEIKIDSSGEGRCEVQIGNSIYHLSGEKMEKVPCGRPDQVKSIDLDRLSKALDKMRFVLKQGVLPEAGGIFPLQDIFSPDSWIGTLFRKISSLAPAIGLEAEKVAADITLLWAAELSRGGLGQKRKVLLIASPIYQILREKGRRAGYFVAPPLGLYRIKAYLEKKELASVDVFDPNLCSKDEAYRKLAQMLSTGQYDIVGFGLTHLNMQDEFDLIDHVKKTVESHGLSMPLLLGGGAEVTHNYGQWLEKSSLDAVVLGYGETVLEEIIKRFPRREKPALTKAWFKGIAGLVYYNDQGMEERGPARPLTAEAFREITFKNEPTRLVPYQQYWNHNRNVYEPENLLIRGATLKTIRLFTSSHCLNACGFCSSWNFLIAASGRDAPIHYLSAEDVYSLVLQNVRRHQPDAIFFNDDDFIIDRTEGTVTRERILEFCRMIVEAKADGHIPADLKFYAQTKVRNITFWDDAHGMYVPDLELLQAMKEAGFGLIALGIESFSDRLLQSPSINKKTTKAQSIAAVNGVLKVGIIPLLDLILMPPEVTKEDFLETADAVVEFVRKGAQLSINAQIEWFPGSNITTKIEKGEYPYTTRTVFSRKTDEQFEIPFMIMPHDPTMRIVAEKLGEERMKILAQLQANAEWQFRYPSQLINGLIYFMAIFKILAGQSKGTEAAVMRNRAREIESLIWELIRTAKPVREKLLTLQQIDHLVEHAYRLMKTPFVNYEKAADLVTMAGDLKEVRPKTYRKIIGYLSLFLERVIEGEVSIEGNRETVSCVAHGLAQIDVESARTERALALLNLKFGIVTPVLSDYYVDEENIVSFIPEGPVVHTPEGIDGRFSQKNVMIFEPHHDDALSYLGNIMEQRVIPNASKTTLVTVISDFVGVTDAYALRYARWHGIRGITESREGMNNVKALIREREGMAFAKALGIERDYINIRCRASIRKEEVDKDGRLLSYYSVFQPPTKKYEGKIYKELCKREPEILIIPYPKGSYHQHHRDVARMLIKAAIAYNKTRRDEGKEPAQIYLYGCNGGGFASYGIRPNVINFFGTKGESRKKQLFQNYSSQLARVASYPEIMSKTDRGNAIRAYAEGLWEAEAGAFYAETLLKVRISPSEFKIKEEKMRVANAIEGSVNIVLNRLARMESGYLRIHVFDGNIFYETPETFDFLPVTTGEDIAGEDGLLKRLKLVSVLIDRDRVSTDWKAAEDYVRRLIISLVEDDAEKLKELLKDKRLMIRAEASVIGKEQCEAEGISPLYWQDMVRKQLKGRKRIVIAGQQPGYHRYLGVLHKMSQSDVFVFSDEFQYSATEWQNRQRFRTSGDEKKWLSVPLIKGRMKDRIIDKKIDNSQPWRQKHWATIKQAYKDEPYFEQYAGFLEKLYRRDWHSLNDLNEAITRYVAKQLGITDTLFIRASLLGEIPGRKAEHIANLIESLVGRDVIDNPSTDVVYLSGRGAIAYLERERPEGILERDLIVQRGINLEIQEYEPKKIKSKWGVDPYASAIEVLFQLGPRARELLALPVKVTSFDRSVLYLQNAAIIVMHEIKEIESRKPDLTFEERAMLKAYAKFLEIIYREVERRFRLRRAKVVRKSLPVVLVSDRYIDWEGVMRYIKEAPSRVQVFVLGKRSDERKETLKGFLEEDPAAYKKVKDIVMIEPEKTMLEQYTYELLDEEELIDMYDEKGNVNSELISTDDEAIRRSAFVIMAAGAGTRLASLLELPHEDQVHLGLRDLGVDKIETYSKPTVPFTKIKCKSPLQLAVESVAAIARDNKIDIPLVIVCTPTNRDVIVRILRNNRNFGLREIILKEDFLGPPIFDSKGRILKGEKELILSGGGTGGTLRALRDRRITVVTWDGKVLEKRISPFKWLERYPVKDLYLLQCDMAYNPQLLRLLVNAKNRKGKELDLVALGYGYPPTAEYKLGTLVKRIYRKTGRREYVVVEYRDRSRRLQREIDTMGAEQRLPAYAGAVGINLDIAKKFVKEDRFTPYIHWSKRELLEDGSRAIVNKLQYSLTELFGVTDSVGMLMTPFEEVAPIKDPQKLAFARSLLVERHKRTLKLYGVQSISDESAVEISPLARITRIGRNVSIFDEASVYFGGSRDPLNTITIGDNVAFRGNGTVIFDGDSAVIIGNNVVFKGNGTTIIKNPRGDPVIIPEGAVIETGKDECLVLSSAYPDRRRLLSPPAGHKFNTASAMKWAWSLLGAGVFITAIAAMMSLILDTPWGCSLGIGMSGFYLLVSGIRYYFLGRATYRALRDYIFQGRDSSGIKITASWVFRKGIAFRRDDGSIEYHPAFWDLSEKVQKLIHIHESFRLHFWGMVAMLPVFGLLGRAVRHVYILYWKRLPDIAPDYSNMPGVVEYLIYKNVAGGFLPRGYQKGVKEVPVEEASPIVKLRDRRRESGAKRRGEMLTREGECVFCKALDRSGEVPGPGTKDWVFSVMPGSIFVPQITAISREHISHDAISRGHYSDIFKMLKNLKGWQVSLAGRAEAGVPEHLHMDIFKREGPAPVETYPLEAICLAGRGKGVVYAVENYPDSEHAIAGFVIPGDVEAPEILARRCAALEMIIRSSGYNVDKFIVRDGTGSGRIKVFFYPVPGGRDTDIGPVALSGIWSVRGEEEYNSFGLKNIHNILSRSALSCHSEEYQTLVAAINKHFLGSRELMVPPVETDSAARSRAAVDLTALKQIIPGAVEGEQFSSGAKSSHAFRARSGFTASHLAWYASMGSLAIATLRLFVQNDLTGIMLGAVLGGIYFGWAAVRYFFAGRATYKALREYYKAHPDFEDYPHTNGIPSPEQLRKIPIAKSDGYRHPAFYSLPAKIRNIIDLHESYTHLKGMFAMLPLAGVFTKQKRFRTPLFRVKAGPRQPRPLSQPIFSGTAAFLTVMFYIFLPTLCDWLPRTPLTDILRGTAYAYSQKAREKVIEISPADFKVQGNELFLDIRWMDIPRDLTGYVLEFTFKEDRKANIQVWFKNDGWANVYAYPELPDDNGVVSFDPEKDARNVDEFDDFTNIAAVGAKIWPGGDTDRADRVKEMLKSVRLVQVREGIKPELRKRKKRKKTEPLQIQEVEDGIIEINPGAFRVQGNELFLDYGGDLTGYAIEAVFREGKRAKVQLWFKDSSWANVYAFPKWPGRSGVVRFDPTRDSRNVDEFDDFGSIGAVGMKVWAGGDADQVKEMLAKVRLIPLDTGSASGLSEPEEEGESPEDNIITLNPRDFSIQGNELFLDYGGDLTGYAIEIVFRRGKRAKVQLWFKNNSWANVYAYPEWPDRNGVVRFDPAGDPRNVDEFDNFSDISAVGIKVWEGGDADQVKEMLEKVRLVLVSPPGPRDQRVTTTSSSVHEVAWDERTSSWEVDIDVPQNKHTGAGRFGEILFDLNLGNYSGQELSFEVYLTGEFPPNGIWIDLARVDDRGEATRISESMGGWTDDRMAGRWTEYTFRRPAGDLSNVCLRIVFDCFNRPVIGRAIKVRIPQELLPDRKVSIPRKREKAPAISAGAVRKAEAGQQRVQRQQLPEGTIEIAPDDFIVQGLELYFDIRGTSIPRDLTGYALEAEFKKGKRAKVQLYFKNYEWDNVYANPLWPSRKGVVRFNPARDRRSVNQFDDFTNIYAVGMKIWSGGSPRAVKDMLQSIRLVPVEKGTKATGIIGGTKEEQPQIPSVPKTVPAGPPVITPYLRTLAGKPVAESRPVPIREFHSRSGVSLYIDYGYDIGGDRGFHKRKDALVRRFKKYKSQGINLVRIFTFCDLRNGAVLFDKNGRPVGFDDNALEDFKTLIMAAHEAGIRLIPVLFDFMLADRVWKEGAVVVGEHPNLLTNQEHKEALLGIFRQFFIELRKFMLEEGCYEAWLAGEPMNEPEMTRFEGMPPKTLTRYAQSFVEDFAALLREVFPDKPISLSAQHRRDLVHWIHILRPGDIMQVHWYRGMGRGETLDEQRSALNIPPDVIVIYGEAEPSDVENVLRKAYDTGHGGVLFWHDGFYNFLNSDKVNRYRDWFSQQRKRKGYKRRGYQKIPHRFVAVSGFRASFLTGGMSFLAVLSGIFHYSIQGDFTGITLMAILSGLYFGWAAVRYFFAGRATYKALREYYKAHPDFEDYPHTNGIPSPEQLRKIPIATSDGYRHPAFYSLPAKIRNIIDIHESYTHVKGMFAMLPFAAMFTTQKQIHAPPGFDEIAGARRPRQREMIALPKMRVISSNLHSVVLSHPDLDYVVKVRNVPGDVNYSYDNYRKYRNRQGCGRIGQYFIISDVNVNMEDGSTRTYDTAVIQEKVEPLSDLIDEALRKRDIRRAKQLLGAFVTVHERIGREGLIDKLFCTAGEENPQKRKYLTNIGFSRRRGKWVHIDCADLTDKVPPADTLLNSIENIKNWFPYRDNAPLAEYFNKVIVPQLKALAYRYDQQRRLLSVKDIISVPYEWLYKEYESDYTKNHAKRVEEIAGLLARQMGLPKNVTNMITRTAAVHDLGSPGFPIDRERAKAARKSLKKKGITLPEWRSWDMVLYDSIITELNGRRGEFTRQERETVLDCFQGPVTVHTVREKRIILTRSQETAILFHHNIEELEDYLARQSWPEIEKEEARLIASVLVAADIIENGMNRFKKILSYSTFGIEPLRDTRWFLKNRSRIPAGYTFSVLRAFDRVSETDEFKYISQRAGRILPEEIPDVFRVIIKRIPGIIKRVLSNPENIKMLLLAIVALIFRETGSITLLLWTVKNHNGEASEKLDITDISTHRTHNREYRRARTVDRLNHDMNLKQRYVRITLQNGEFVMKGGDDVRPIGRRLIRRLNILSRPDSRLMRFIRENEESLSKLTIYLLDSDRGRDRKHPLFLTAEGRDFEVATSGSNGGREQAVYMTRAAFQTLDIRLLTDILINQIRLAIARYEAWHEGRKFPFGDPNSPITEKIVDRIRSHKKFQDELRTLHKYEMGISDKYAINVETCKAIEGFLKTISEKMPGFGPAILNYNRAIEFRKAVENHDYDSALKWWGLITYEFRELRSDNKEKARQLLSLPETTIFLSMSKGINELFNKYVLEEGICNLEGEEYGKAVGTVRVIDDIEAIDEEFKKARGDEIWVLHYLPAAHTEIPGRGCIISVAGNRHAIDTAKQQCIPLAVIPDAVSLLKGYEGKQGMLRVGRGRDVRFRTAFADEKGIPREKEEVTVKVPGARTDGRLIYKLDEVDDNFITFIGSKAANLGKLINAGINVPDGVALSFAFWDRFSKHNKLDERIAEIRRRIEIKDGKITTDRETLEQALSEIKGLIVNAEIPEDLKEALFGHVSRMRLKFGQVGFYVRSSFNFEDLTENPTPGYYDSYPDKNFPATRSDEDILRAIKMVFASKWNMKAFKARIETGIPDSDVLPAVIVQAPLKSVCAGTMYTANPYSYDRGSIAILASHGQGAAVVGEDGRPAQVVINKLTGEVEESRPTSEVDVEYRLDMDEGEMKVEFVPGESIQKEILVPSLIRRLKKLGETIEAMYDFRPQDIEWCLGEDGKIWVVQSRAMRMEGLPAEKLFLDDKVLDLLAEIEENRLNKLMNARRTGDIDILLDGFNPETDYAVIRKNSRDFGVRMVSSRYLSLLADDERIVGRITRPQVRRIIEFFRRSHINLTDPTTSPELLSFLRKTGAASSNPEIKKDVRNFFEYLSTMSTRAFAHTIDFEIAKALISYGLFNAALGNIRDASGCAYRPDVAYRSIRILSTIPTPEAVEKIETFTRSDKLPEGTKRYALRAMDKVRMHIFRTAEYNVTVGVSKAIYEKIEKAQIYALEGRLGVRIVGVEPAEGSLMARELEQKTMGQKGIAALLDIDEVADINELERIIVDLRDRVRQDIIELIHPEMENLTEENVRRIRDIKELKNIAGLFIRLLPNVYSYRLTEKSLYDIRMNNLYDLHRKAYTPKLREYLDSDMGGEAGRHYMVTAVDRAFDLKMLARSIEERREVMEITVGEEDPVKDFVIVRNKDITEENIGEVLVATGMSNYLSPDRIIVLEEGESLTPEQVMKVIEAKTGKTVLRKQIVLGQKGNCGSDIIEVNLDKPGDMFRADKEDSLLFVQLGKEGQGLVSQLYGMMLEIMANRDTAPSWVTEDVLQQVEIEGTKYNVYLYLPEVQAIDFEAEVEAYDRYVLEVLVKA